eukprot:TRINITY_DN20147_c0_g1_i1.p1 TRINITY_DN20147_c0_g1~~TRINITY_DN20147_c0_g1_i1.p1  ORF type:complete len:136 (-),score=5.39 TRINITY_DN20147_c0_g1_i1:15-422(-)
MNSRFLSSLTSTSRINKILAKAFKYDKIQSCTLSSYTADGDGMRSGDLVVYGIPYKRSQKEKLIEIVQEDLVKQGFEAILLQFEPSLYLQSQRSLAEKFDKNIDKEELEVRLQNRLCISFRTEAIKNPSTFTSRF